MVRNKIKVLILVLFILLNFTGVAQKRHEGFIIACPQGSGFSNHKVPPPLKYYEYKSNQGARTANQSNTVINVTYNGFENFPEAQAAYQFAVDVWASLLVSDQPINISADFRDLGGGILAQAGPTSLWSDFGVANLDDSTIYHVALAEKIAGRQLNDPGEADVVANFNSTVDWYFGTDGNVPNNQQEFVATVLHEIGHGLGFSSLDDYNAGIGTVFPGSYNNYIVDNLNNSIYTVPNGTRELGDFLTSDNLFISSSSVLSINGGPAKIYAPFTYNGGSSISHLGENFNNTENACMTFSGTPGESIQDPGPIVIGFFEDMGWLGSSLYHTPEIFVENSDEPFLISLEIRSDIPFEEGLDVPIIHYSFDGFATDTETALTANGDGTYQIEISRPQGPSNLTYYFDGLKDRLRGYSAPAEAVSRSGVTNTYSVLFKSEEFLDSGLTLDGGGDFENSGLFVPYNLLGTGTLWEYGAPSNVLDMPSSGSNAWKTGLDEGVSKPAIPIVAGLVTPTFSLADTNSHYTLGFDLFMDLDNNSMIGSVLYTTDNGNSWNLLGDVSDQRGTNWFDTRSNEIGSGWSLNTTSLPGESLSVEYNLDQLIGEDSLIFSIVYFLSDAFADEDYGYDGMMIDDFQLLKGDPKATFISSDEGRTVFPGDPIEFEYASSGATQFAWDFGDGTTSDERNPSHSYQESGEYEVTLTISFAGGSDVQAKTISVEAFKVPNYRIEDGGGFELNQSDFFAENVSGTGWELGESAVVGKSGTSSGSNAWVTGLEAETYFDQSTAYLYSPLFDFSTDGRYELSFEANYNVEVTWDGFIVEYTANNGVSWQQLAPVVAEGWYDVLGTDNPEQGWPAIPLFSANTNDEFVLKSRDISNLAGNTSVGFRFYWKSDFAETGVGVAIDNFVLKGPVGPATLDFTASVQTVCSGQEVQFVSTSSGSIETLTWDFGPNASPQTARGAGPHAVVYSSDQLVSNTVSLTAESSVSGTVVDERVEFITVVPDAVPEITLSNNNSEIVLQASVGDTYQWFLNGEIIAGETSQELVISRNGTYSVEVGVGDCLNLSDDFVVDILLSISDESGLAIYPNPSNGTFTLNLDRSEVELADLKIEIYAMSGKKVNSEMDISRVTSTEYQVSTIGLENGFYLLQIIIDNRLIIRKIAIDD